MPKPERQNRRLPGELERREAEFRIAMERLEERLWASWQAIDGRNWVRFIQVVEGLPSVRDAIERLMDDPRSGLFTWAEAHILWCIDAFDELIRLVPRQRVKFEAIKPAEGRLPVSLPELLGEIRIDHKGQVMSPFDFRRDIDDYPIQLRGNS